MMAVLENIAALQEAIREVGKTIEAVSSWSDWCQIIETSITLDHRATAHEKQEVERLKRAVSDAILYMRQTSLFPEDYAHLIGVILTGLRASIGSRATGPDGWPLRK